MHLDRLYIEIPAIGRNTPGSYAVAAAATLIATTVRLALGPYVAGAHYGPFYLAVMATTLLSGLRAGVGCAVLCALALDLFVLEPRGSLRVAQWSDLAALTQYLFVSIAMVAVISAMRRAIRRYQELAQTLEERVEERSRALLAAQERLAQSQKMEVLGQLTAGLAHDFNNMNAVVIGNLDLVRRRLARGETDVAKYLDNAEGGAERAARLTQRLLSFARRQPLAPAVTDINKLALGMSELLKRTLGERITLKCVAPQELWKAFVDPNQLENAIVNLAVNARDAMPDGGTLTIETANGYLDEDYASRQEEVAPGEYVVVAVSDTGRGMTPEIASRAIEPFFTTKKEGRGTGLGLSQVYGFVRQSGGHLTIYSEEERGTTVRLYLPRADAAPLEAGEKSISMDPLPAGSPGETVLIVEDEDHVRRMGVAALRELGYRVYDAANGQEALKALRQQPQIELLLTDVVMPGMNGPQVAEAARSHIPGIRVLYTTGYTRSGIAYEGVLDPGIELLGKPFTIDELARKVRSVLDDRKAAAGT